MTRTIFKIFLSVACLALLSAPAASFTMGQVSSSGVGAKGDAAAPPVVSVEQGSQLGPTDLEGPSESLGRHPKALGRDFPRIQRRMLPTRGKEWNPGRRG